MRRPDFTRRVAVTGLGIISPVGQDIPTAWHNLVEGHSGLRRITYWDPSKLDCQAAGEVHDFDPNAWMDFKAVRRTDKNVVFGVAAAKQAVADAGLRDHPAEQRRHRRRLRLRRRRPGPDDGSHRDVGEEGPAPGQPVLHRQHAARHGVGPDRHRDRRPRPEHVHRHGLLDRHPQHRRGGRGHPARRLRGRHLRLDRDAPLRGRLHRLLQHARHGHAARGRAPRDDLAPVRPDARRLRPRRGRGRHGARGPRARQGARGPRLRRGGRLRLGRRRVGPHPAGREGRRDAAGHRDGAGAPRRAARRDRPHQPPRDVHAARRPARGAGHLGRLRRPHAGDRHQRHEVDDRPPDGRRGRGRGRSSPCCPSTTSARRRP